MICQTILPFKLETTKDLITAHAGLALFGEFAVGPALKDALDKYLPGLAGKVVFRGHYVYLKVRRSVRELFAQVRLGSWEFAQT